MSPTKSLIDDLLLRCGTLEIRACKFTADVPKDTQDTQLLHLKNYKIILTTPEMLSKDNDFYRKIVQVSDADQLDRIVVDEAHTVVTWGDTFRPLYQNVCKELAKIISCPILLLSASVTVRLKARLHEIFGDFIKCSDHQYYDPTSI